MIFNSKQLEELENINDSTGAFEEEGDDEGGFDEVGEAAMDWRRGLIEEAAENIKRAKTRPVESHLTYPIGSMLFEREARRFARVQRSVPGYLKVVYLSGGDREFGTLDVAGYLRDYGAEKRLSELAEQLGMNDGDVATELERLGIAPLEEAEGEVVEAAGEEAAAAAAPAAPPLPVSRARKATPVNVDAEDEQDAAPAVVATAGRADKAAAKASPAKASPAKAPPAKAPPAKAHPAKAHPVKTAAAPFAEKAPRPKASPAKPAPAKAEKTTEKGVKARAKAPEKPVAAGKAVGGRPEGGRAAPAPKAAAPAKGGKINPIDDPNGYIKAHYQELSNRELARLTGLSEHTIRRKLGEWGMRRKPQ